jgi:8-oxo-dGTP diphosphatase
LKINASNQKIWLVIGAVVTDKRSRVLLVKYAERKRRRFYYGKWLCPAGSLRFGESLEEGASREVKEETGLDIRITGHALTYDRVFVERGRQVQVVFVGFHAVPLRGRLQAGSDAAYARWFTKSELGRRSDELHEDTRRLLSAAGLMKAIT